MAVASALGIELGSSMSTDHLPILDLAQLRRQSLGDPALEVEILALFSTELEGLLRQVEEAAGNHQRGERLRAIIAVARNTGAARLSTTRALPRRISLRETLISRSCGRALRKLWRMCAAATLLQGRDAPARLDSPHLGSKPEPFSKNPGT